ncbi:MAG: hypothetical protein ACRBDL_02330 [Alphaproteobacteria bacterium]
MIDDGANENVNVGISVEDDENARSYVVKNNQIIRILELEENPLTIPEVQEEGVVVALARSEAEALQLASEPRGDFGEGPLVETSQKVKPITHHFVVALSRDEMDIEVDLLRRLDDVEEGIDVAIIEATSEKDAMYMAVDILNERALEDHFSSALSFRVPEMVTLEFDGGDVVLGTREPTQDEIESVQSTLAERKNEVACERQNAIDLGPGFSM